MTVKSISGRQLFVCGSSDNKATDPSLLAAPPGSILYEFTTGSPDTVLEWISFGGGVWAQSMQRTVSST